jgi:hypothetical protein
MDVPEETVVQHDRNLVVAGLRTTGARGINAPAVTPLDAARLLIGVLASVRTKDSVDTVRAFNKTRFEAAKSEEEWFEVLRAKGRPLPNVTPSASKFSDPAITALPPDHNLIDALAALISDASLPVTNLDDHIERFATLLITCHSPVVEASIGRIGQRAGSAYYRLAKYPAQPAYAEYYGMKQSRAVAGLAIMLLGRAFRENGLNSASTKEELADFLRSNIMQGGDQAVTG